MRIADLRIHAQLLVNGGFEVSKSFLNSDAALVGGGFLTIADTLIDGWAAIDDNDPEFRTVILTADALWLEENFRPRDAFHPGQGSYPEPAEGNTSIQFMTVPAKAPWAGTPAMLVTELREPLKKGSVYEVSISFNFPFLAEGDEFSGIDVHFFSELSDMEALVYPQPDTSSTGQPMLVPQVFDSHVTIGRGNGVVGRWNRASEFIRMTEPCRYLTVGLWWPAEVGSRLGSIFCYLDDLVLKEVDP